MRRFPEDTPAYYGTFDYDTAAESSQVCSGFTFVTPWAALTHWTPLAGSPGPSPRKPATLWLDPFWQPPTDGQHIWLRRWDMDSAAVTADWRYEAQSFQIKDTTWLLPWYLVWKWKPR